MNEIDLETELKSRSKATRVTLEHIESVIVAEQYYVFPNSTLTVCALTLRNGFIVTGESASASADNFDKEIGRRIARDNAKNKIWMLEGYLLRDQLSKTT